MIQTLAKTIRVAKVYPGPYGGAVIVGVPIGEHIKLRCKLSYRVVTRLPEQGEFWLVEGTMVDNPKHGPQLAAKSGRPTDLPSPSCVGSLLANHTAFRGFAFGRKKIGDVIKTFGEEGLVKLLDEGNIHRLTETIEMRVAKGLVNAWQALRNENATINFLIDHRFSTELACKVMALCQEGVVERLKKNPYALVCFGGVTRNIWGAMEKCATKLGFFPEFEGRSVGGIEHILYEHLRAGHTVIGKADLLSKAGKLLGTRKRAEDGLRIALEQKAVCIYPQEHEPLFQLVGVGIIEQTLERRIMTLVSGPRQLPLFGVDESRIKILVYAYDEKVRAAGGLGMSPDQMNAVLMALTNCCSVLTGYGGTGKTTVLKAIADIAKSLGRRTYMLALAGKAKERLGQVTGYKSFTIHAFISAVKKGSDEIYLDDDPLIIIDECSMVGTALFNNLLGLFEGKPYSLLTVGDTDQISPVSFGLVWHRMVKLNFIPRTNLTQVFRYRSLLHEAAMKVRSRDEMVLEGIADAIQDWNGEAEGVYFVQTNAQALRETLFKLKTSVDGILRQQVKAKFQSTLQWGASFQNSLHEVGLEARMKAAENAGGIPKAIILTPHMSRRMLDSGDKINRHLQGCLTPLAESLMLGDWRLRVGDPVIVSENAYALGLFNGTTGTLLRVSVRDGKASGCFRMEGHKDPVWLSIDELLNVGMRVAYAMSIHKSQGSEYEAVLVTCIANSPMVEKSLIYTALTRSKELCLIVGSREVFSKAVRSPGRAETLEVGFFLSKMN